jgi:hypothetical protein
MLTPIRDMPAGTVGFEAIGKVDDDDFSDTVEPVAARHPHVLRARVVVVSDVERLRPALRVISVLVPGQLRAFPVAQLPAAKDRVVAGDRAEAGDDQR